MRSEHEIKAFGVLLQELSRLSETSPRGQEVTTAVVALYGMHNVVRWVLGDDVVDERGLTFKQHLIDLIRGFEVNPTKRGGDVHGDDASCL